MGTSQLHPDIEKPFTAYQKRKVLFFLKKSKQTNFWYVSQKLPGKNIYGGVSVSPQNPD